MEVLQNQELSLEDPDSAAEWDRFVGQNPWGTAFHTSAWLDVLQKEGFEVLRLTFKKEGNIVAVAPFCLLPWFHGLARVGVSLPRSDVGGPLIDPEMPESAFAPILAKSLQRMLAKRVVSWSAAGLREPLRAMPGKPRPLRGFYPIINLNDAPPARIWSSVFTKRGNQRKDIRRIERDGLSTTMATKSDLLEFHSLYKLTVQRAGGNPYPYAFFETVWKTLKQNFRILLVKESGRVVGGSGFLCFPERKLLHMSYCAYARDVMTRGSVNLYRFWKTIVWANENGYQTINAGTGDSRFKRQFGCGLVEKRAVRFVLLGRSSISKNSETTL
ncbi:MAG: GNAT family N-acetyltransferase [Nitrososphaerales archaeon]|jgi:CelD/BcsL family acetyltransferase involved in cellulose biosynthesis